MQHAQALQSLNGEVVALQSQLLAELRGLPAAADSLFPAGQGFRSSLLSLVADFLDSSLLALAADLRALPCGDTCSGAPAGPEVEQLLRRHLQWLDVAWTQRGEEDLWTALLDDALPAPVPRSVRVQVALLPDPRGKTLFLASLVDPKALRALLADELRLRLRELLGQPHLPPAPPVEMEAVEERPEPAAEPSPSPEGEGLRKEEGEVRAFGDIDEDAPSLLP